MCSDISKILEYPSQLFGAFLLIVIGALLVYKALSKDKKALQKSRKGALYSDIFFFLFAIISIVPSIIVWEILRRNKRFMI